MAAPKTDIDSLEDKVKKLIVSPELSEEEVLRLGLYLGAIISGVFEGQSADSGLRNWVVDDFIVTEIKQSNNKVTLWGDLYWSSGGGECCHYQVDIARDTDPMLYSYKLRNKHGHQVLYVGKTYQGWVVNE